MRILVKLAITAGLLTMATPWPVRADDADAKVRKSVVKILSKSAPPRPIPTLDQRRGSKKPAARGS